MKQHNNSHLNTVGMKVNGPDIEQRKYVRLNAMGMEVDIADRIGFCTGTIKDISRFGVCITDIPRKVRTKNNFISVVISTKDKHFKLQLRPQWEKQEGLTMVTGTIIDEAPLDWTKMIMQLEPQNNDILSTKSPVAAQRSGLIKTLRRGVVFRKTSP
jgi:hypothetical protein